MGKLSLPLAAVLGLGLGALASSCGHDPLVVEVGGLGNEVGARLAARIDDPTPPPVYQTPPEDWLWTAWLPDVLPATRACRAAAPEPEAVITQAWPVEQGRIGVHLRGPGGARWECVAPDHGLDVVRLDPLPDNAAPEGPVFVPEGIAVPPACGEARVVTDAAGRVIGRLAAGPC